MAQVMVAVHDASAWIRERIDSRRALGIGPAAHRSRGAARV